MRKSLLKLLSLMLCVMLTLGASAPALAAAVTVVSASDEGEEENISGAAVVGDTIYYSVSGANGISLYARKAADPAVTALGSVGELENAPKNVTIDALFTWNDKLCGLSLQDGAFYTLLDEQGALAMTKQEPALDTSAFVQKEDDAIYTNAPSALFAMGDHLYYTARDYSQGYSATAGSISLLTGESKVFQTKNITALAPYEDGKLVAYLYDASALYSMDNNAAQDALQQAGECAVFDPETDTTGTAWPVQTDSILGGLSVGGFCYGNHTVYFGSGSRIMGMNMQTGESRVSGYTGGGLYGDALNGGMVTYADGYYVSFGASGMMVYQLDSPNLAKGALRIYGEMGSDAHKSFVKNYPDIPVEVSGKYSTNLEELTQAMVTENNPCDVLLLNLSYMPVDRLLKKGYCADLTADAELWDIVNQMYPQFGEILQKDGKLFGVATEVSAYTFGVNKKNWEEIGLSEEDIPKSYIELLDFAANWSYDYADDYPDIALFDYSKSSLMIFSLMLQDYLAYTQYKGENTLFNTPVYRDLLKAFEAVDFAEIDKLMGTDSFYVPSDKALFTLYTQLVPMSYHDANISPMYLSVAQGEEPFVTGSVTVMIVNPKTTRMNDALLYVKNYLRNLPKDGARITLFPDHNEPVENRFYARNKEEAEESIRKKTEQLATASEENKAAIRDEITSLELNLAELEKDRYAVTPEQIQNYRDNIIPKMFVQRQNILYSADNKAMTEINTLMMQYVEGAIDADKMVTELDNRLRLMAMEDN